MVMVVQQAHCPRAGCSPLPLCRTCQQPEGAAASSALLSSGAGSGGDGCMPRNSRLYYLFHVIPLAKAGIQTVYPVRGELVEPEPVTPGCALTRTQIDTNPNLSSGEEGWFATTARSAAAQSLFGASQESNQKKAIPWICFLRCFVTARDSHKSSVRRAPVGSWCGFTDRALPARGVMAPGRTGCLTLRDEVHWFIRAGAKALQPRLAASFHPKNPS